MGPPDIIVVGASAGGVETLCEFVHGLPSDLPAAVFIVLHIGPGSPGTLPNILGRRTKLPVAHAVDGEPVVPGRVYVAPPDGHLLVTDRGTIRIGRGPKENGHRPSIDVLFRSAAAAYGPRVVGVVLSGTRDDGTAGLRAIHQRGGRAMVQDPEEALFPQMPRSALAGDNPDYVLPVARIAEVVTELARKPHTNGGELSRSPAGELDAELQWLNPDLDRSAPLDPPAGEPSGFTCPECHGALWEIEDGGAIRYRCRIGHGFSAESLATSQGGAVEAALWTAYRALEERVALLDRLAKRAELRQAGIMAEHFRVEGASVARQAATLRDVLWTSRADRAQQR